MAVPAELDTRLRSLEDHLRAENPVLLGAVQSFRRLDGIARGLGLLSDEESYATRIPWWPLVAVLGTYSSGKSTFINDFLGQRVQVTGNQAVDDRFSVLCFGTEPDVRVLPGVALDADPRFPFYKMSRAIEEISPGEGSRIDAYLQLKTCPGDMLRGRILIDSPGFDADQQRTATLRVTDRIVDLADLVLVFFDARHPEPGAMQDTLQHLVAGTIHRADSSKFLYILNQMDHAARENNPEDIVGSWQRALSQKGLTAGRFYSIYSPSAALVIEDAGLRASFEKKRDADLAEIRGRISQVAVDRCYRIMGVLERTARDIEMNLVPRLQEMVDDWRRRVRRWDGIAFAVLAVLAVAVLVWAVWEGQWSADSAAPSGDQGAAEGGAPGDGGWSAYWAVLSGESAWTWGILAVATLVAGYVHHTVRRLASWRVLRALRRSLGEDRDTEVLDALTAAFRRNTRFGRNVFSRRPAGWNASARQRLSQVITEANGYVQTLNDQFTNPGGRTEPAPPADPPADAPAVMGPSDPAER